MKIIIDTDKIKDVSIDELFYLYHLYYKKKLDYKFNLNNLIDNKYIRKIKEETYIKQKGINLINNLLNGYIEEKQEKKISSRKIAGIITDDSIKEFRLLWKGLKPGAMGSPTGCKIKLKRFFKENPDKTMDDVIKAAKIYIQSLKGDYKYIQQADYFIKKGADSRLSAFIEEIDNIEIVNDGWTNNII